MLGIDRILLTWLVLVMPSAAAAGTDVGGPAPAHGAAHLEPAASAATTDSDDLAPSEVRAQVQEWRAEQLAQSDWVTLIGPYYSIAGDDRATLVLTNGFAEPLEFKLSAANSEGALYPLGSYRINPRSQIQVDLRDALADAGTAFRSGSVSATFFGDTTMAQGWVVQRRGTAIREIPFQATGTSRGGDETAVGTYWDLRLLPDGLEPRFYIVNPGDSYLTFTSAMTDGGQRLQSGPTVLGPRSQMRLAPSTADSLDVAAVKILQEPGADMPILESFLEGPGTLLRLPTFQTGSGELATEYVSMEARLQEDETGRRLPPRRLVLTLFNTEAVAQRVQVAIVAHESGDVLEEFPVVLDGMEVRSVDVTHGLGPSGATRDPSGAVRLKISAQLPLATPIATVISVDGDLVPLELYSTAHLHPGGRFSIPDLEKNKVWTTVLNVGEEPAEVYGQLFWDGGTYAIPEPLVIPPRGSGTFDFQKIIEEATPDLLGRKPPNPFGAGYFQWVPGPGAIRVVSRTHIQATDDSAPIGTNCLGCCWDRPWGTVVPSGSVNFSVGQTRTAITSVVHDTCSGQQGPWALTPQTLTVPSPFSWNAQVVGATGVATKTLSSDGPSIPWTKPTCFVVQKLIKTFLTADTCAFPKNFRLVSATSSGTGGPGSTAKLTFDYKYDSSTGKYGDLSSCFLGEKVTYPSPNKYYSFPSPPFALATTFENPTINNFTPTTGLIQDTLTFSNAFRKPYTGITVGSIQTYRYKCPCKNGGKWTPLLSQITITDSVGQDPNNTWEYTLASRGKTAKIKPLP